MEEIGVFIQEEVNTLRARLFDASEINQVREILQKENETLRREVLRLREQAPSVAPQVLRGSSSSAGLRAGASGGSTAREADEL